MDACDVARTYIDLTEQGRYEQVGELFSSDAVFYNPAGVILVGSDNIKTFYANFLPTIRPKNRISSLVSSGDVCVMEIETRMAPVEDGHLWPSDDGVFMHTAIDRMTVDAEGKIKHMIVYKAPPNFWQR